MSSQLTASEAAARLGVKKSTLYAYVSRGLISRRTAAEGRTSVFESREIDAFRSGRRRASEGELDTVVATAITHVGEDALRIRGRDLVGTVDAGASFEEVVEWLWEGEDAPWVLAPNVEAAVVRAQRAMPRDTPLIDRLRVTTAVVSATDPLRFDRSEGGVYHAGRTLLLAMATGLPGSNEGAGSTGGGIATALWPRLTSRRGSAHRRGSLDAALALMVDHGLASSTFAARVAASVRADPYSIVGAGLGVVGGTLHGAASAGVHALLLEAHRIDDPVAAIGEVHRRSGGLPGVGHKVYQEGDPRFTALMTRVRQGWHRDSRLDVVGSVEGLIADRSDAFPNVDFALGALTWLAGMAPDAGEAIFAISRTAGWIAHGLEEYGELPLRFRPRARFTGPGPLPSDV